MHALYYFYVDKSTILDYNNFMIYDRFQQEAIDHINSGHSVIVSAPTGAGKTAIAKYIISYFSAYRLIPPGSEQTDSA